MKLMPMTEFVLSQKETQLSEQDLSFSERELKKYKRIVKYAEFLKLLLTLGMFVPTDEFGNILKEPEEYLKWIKAIELDPFNYYADGWDGCKNYHEAKEKVLFEGFEFSHDNNYNTVLKFKTESSIKVELQFRKSEEDIRLIVNSDYIYDCHDVERLVGLKTKPELTPFALKVMGINN